MKVLITGGGGLIGFKLAKKLAADPIVREQVVTSMVLADIVPPPELEAPFPVTSMAADISKPDDVAKMFGEKPDVIFHLAAIVSADAEANFDKGMAVNMFGTYHILEAARHQGNCPIVVYASSAAVHGGDAPDPVVDNIELNPQTSYGTQKAIGEKLVQDYSRRGFIDGRGLRLPTVTIRPGTPNKAASAFMSSIFREPLQGKPSNCPVSRDFPVWHTAPRTVVQNILYAAELPAEDWGYNRNITLSGRSDTIGEMIDAMTRVAGPEAESQITWDADPVIEKIVMGWRGNMIAEKALRLGFFADRSFEDSVKWFLEDDIIR